MFEYSPDPAPLDGTASVMLVVWCVLLVPWVIFSAFMGAGLGDGGHSVAGEILMWFALTYQLLLGVAFYYKRRKPQLVWLPALSLFGVLASALFGTS